mgnify:CR=1 FL=1
MGRLFFMETTGADARDRGLRKGIVAGILSAAAFAYMGQLVKDQSTSIPSSQLAFARGLVGMLLLTPLAYRDLPKLFRAGSLFVWLRSLAGGVGVVVFFMNIKLSLASNARAISNLSPVLTGLLALIFFRQMPRALECLGLLGVVAGASRPIHESNL